MIKKASTFFIVFVFSHLCFSTVSAQQIIDKIVAVVGYRPILLSDIEEQKEQARQQGIKVDKELECQILEELLFEKLLVHQAEIDSLEVSEQEVNYELEQRINYFAAQMKNGIADLEKFYGKSIQEIKEEFFNQIEDRMKSERMRQTITEGVRISPKEVTKFYKSFDPDSIPLINSKIEYAQIVIEPEVTPTEKVEIKRELNAIRDKILSGKLAFKVAADNYSCDPGSAKRGGDFGWVGRGQFVPEFEAIAFTLEIGKMSEVFETTYGYHICIIDERRGEQFKGRHILLCFKPSTDELIKAKLKLDSITNQLNLGKLTWEEAVMKYSTDDDTRATRGIVYNERSGTSQWDMAELDPITFKSIDALKVGEVSKPMLIETFQGSAYMVVKLVAQSPPHKANLKDDYQMIQAYALADKKNTVVHDWINTKIGDVFVRIDPDYRNCDFMHNWLPKN
jgi:peptidyl-prolyl cis-trans isomerase SurA